MGKPMHFLCNEVPQDWNMMKKGTNTLGNVCVAIPPALPQRHSFPAFSQAMKSLWKVTFIPHLTKFTIFFLGKREDKHYKTRLP